MAFIIDKDSLKILNQRTAERLRSQSKAVGRDSRTGVFVSNVHATSEGVSRPEVVAKSKTFAPSKNSKFTTEDIREGLITAKRMVASGEKA